MEINGQWYVFYHRSTHNSQMMRKACMEPIFFNGDGSIDEVEMTSQGAGLPLEATSIIPAERACLLHGNVRIRAFTEDNEELDEIRDQDRAVYKYVDFGAGVDSITVRVNPGGYKGGISMKADMPWGPQIGTIVVPASDGSDSWITLTSTVEDVEGVHALWLMFDGEGEDLFSLDWLKFK